MNKIIVDYLNEYEYGKECIENVFNNWDTLVNTHNDAKFMSIVDRYDNDMMTDFNKMIEDVKSLSLESSINEYELYFLFLLNLIPSLYKHAERSNFDKDILHENLMDLKYKYIECTLVKNKKGTFVPTWFSRWYQLSRVSFGHLQFEVSASYGDYKKDDITINKGDPIINVHIPRTGKHLNHDDLLLEYKKASEYFKNIRFNNHTVFQCESWLLFPKNKEILNEHSNIIKFMNDYDITLDIQYDNYINLWRLFDTEYDNNPDHLPNDSSLRRGYIEFVKNKVPFTSSLGFFVFD